MTGLGFQMSDVFAASQSLITIIGPYLAAVIAIPFTFYLARQIKGLFATGGRG